jgi:hypothetical protein
MSHYVGIIAVEGYIALNVAICLVAHRAKHGTWR